MASFILALRRALGGHAAVLVVLGAPLLLWAGNDTWIWDSPSYFDTNVYVGFFRHYTEFTTPFVDNYKSSRLPFLLPGVALYRLMPATAAHHLLFLLFHGAQTSLVFALVRRRCGTHAAFAAGICLAVSTFAHVAPSYHNQAAAAYFLLSLVVIGSSSLRRGLAAGLAGAAFTMAATTDTLVCAMFPVLALHALATMGPFGWRHVARDVCCGAVGGALALAALGIVNVALGGPALFFVDQVRMTIALGSTRISRVPLVDVARHLDQLPHLTLPAFVTVASSVFVAKRALERQVDARSVEPAGALLASAAAIALQGHGQGVLELDHLFGPFSVAAFVAVGGLLGSSHPPAVAVRARFVVAGAGLAILPLCLLGGPVSNALAGAPANARWPATGFSIALACAVVAALACARLRRRPEASALVLIACFGLMNVAHTGRSQRAHLYQWGQPCSFRRDVFEGLLEADELLGAFDPGSKAVSRAINRPSQEHEAFDGETWCRKLPVDTVPRSFLLSRYFMTTQDFVDQYSRVVRARAPARKLVVAGRDDAEATRQLDEFRASLPADTTLTLVFARRIARPTCSVVLRGYAIQGP